MAPVHRAVRPHPPLRMVALGLVLVLTMLLGVGCGGDDPETDDRGATTVTTTDDATTTEPETMTTSAPTTTGPASTGPTTTVPPASVSVLLVGDSVGFTLQEHVPAEVPGVVSVDGRALAGCGLILSGERPPEAVAAGAPPRYDDCAPAVADADSQGLAADPDVVLLVSGAWEWNDHVRGGRTVGPGDAAWTTEVSDLLRDRVEGFQAAGAAVALWVDPCSPKPGAAERQGWYRDDVLTPVAEQTGAVLVDPTPVVCTGQGTPRSDVPGVGDPRPSDGQHWSDVGAGWLWTTWLGPALAGAAATPG